MKQLTNNRFGLLIVGAIFGAAITTIWPHEPLQATVDRDSKFAIATCPVAPFLEGVFVLGLFNRTTRRRRPEPSVRQVSVRVSTQRGRRLWRESQR